MSGGKMLEIGQMAPDFILKNEKGEDVRLSQFRGKKVVLYFYPKDNTPGCTKEACSLRDSHNEIIESNAIVLGVSPDEGEKHSVFISKFALPFTLLCDTEHKVMELYDAWGEKNMYGKKSIGVLRKTYVIDEKGVITKIFKKVNVLNHGKEVLEALK